MNLTISSYNINHVKKSLINKVMSDFPEATIYEKATLLGISERSLYRYLKTKKKVIQLV
jgi:predicted transcriptional regulator YheO